MNKLTCDFVANKEFFLILENIIKVQRTHRNYI